MNDTPTNTRELSPAEQYDDYIKRCIDQRALAICVEAMQPLIDRLTNAERCMVRIRDIVDDAADSPAPTAWQTVAQIASLMRRTEALEATTHNMTENAASDRASLGRRIDMHADMADKLGSFVHTIEKRLSAVERQVTTEPAPEQPAMFMGCNVKDLHDAIRYANDLHIDQHQKAALHKALEMAIQHARSLERPSIGASS
ncbi:MAG: hypothetical protein R3E87_15090 [Burkholderiaceae bacterium]